MNRKALRERPPNRAQIPQGHCCFRDGRPSPWMRAYGSGVLALLWIAFGSSAYGAFIGIDPNPPQEQLIGFTRPLNLKDYVLYDGRSVLEITFLATGVQIRVNWQGEVRAAVVHQEIRKDIPYLWLEVGYKGKMLTLFGEEERKEIVQILVPEKMVKQGIAGVIADEKFRPAALRIQKDNRPPIFLPPEQWEWAQEQYPALMMIGGINRKQLTFKGSSDESTEIGSIPSKVYEFSRSSVFRFSSGRTEYEWLADGEIYASDSIPFGPVRMILDVTYTLSRKIPGTGTDSPPEYEPVRKIRVSGEWRLKKTGNDAQPWMMPAAPPGK